MGIGILPTYVPISLASFSYGKIWFPELTIGEQRTKPPELKWKVEPKKDKTFPKFKALALEEESIPGSLNRDDYGSIETEVGENGAGCWLEHGQGIELVEGGWFM